jgi:hypothetical protein
VWYRKVIALVMQAVITSEAPFYFYKVKRRNISIDCLIKFFIVFLSRSRQRQIYSFQFFFFTVPVCAITASAVPGGTFVSVNRFSTLCGWLSQRQRWRMKGEYDRVSNRDRLKITPDLTTRWSTENENFVCSSLWDLKSSSRFTYHPRGRCAADFYRP